MEVKYFFGKGDEDVDIVEVHDFIRNLSESQFSQRFADLAESEAFSAVVSGVGTDGDLHSIGAQIQRAGLDKLDPYDYRAVLCAARTITSRIYREHYRP